jgi:hypothetical protein
LRRLAQQNLKTLWQKTEPTLYNGRYGLERIKDYYRDSRAGFRMTILALSGLSHQKKDGQNEQTTNQ